MDQIDSMHAGLDLAELTEKILETYPLSERPAMIALMLRDLRSVGDAEGVEALQAYCARRGLSIAGTLISHRLARLATMMRTALAGPRRQSGFIALAQG
jgi:hypothetical protein